MSNNDDEWYKSSDVVLPYHLCQVMESLSRSVLQTSIDADSVKQVRQRLLELSRVLEHGYDDEGKRDER